MRKSRQIAALAAVTLGLVVMSGCSAHRSMMTDGMDGQQPASAMQMDRSDMDQALPDTMDHGSVMEKDDRMDNDMDHDDGAMNSTKAKTMQSMEGKNGEM